MRSTSVLRLLQIFCDSISSFRREASFTTALGCRVPVIIFVLLNLILILEAQVLAVY
jgi:hypothetical protein